MSNWHRIDDPEHPAPKDGTFVLLFVEHSLGYSIGTGQYKRQGTIEGWLSRGCGLFGELGLANPSHWQPLPEPPRP
jgi:hypothetical protein